MGSGLFVPAWYKKRRKPSMGGQVDINDNEVEYAEDWEGSVEDGNQMIIGIYSVV